MMWIGCGDDVSRCQASLHETQGKNDGSFHEYFQRPRLLVIGEQKAEMRCNSSCYP